MTDIYTNNKEISFDLFKYVAEQFASCMNDNLYVYDIKNDTYYITEGATKRFAVPGSFFNNVLEEHKKFVYPDDFTMLVNDLNQLKALKGLLDCGAINKQEFEEKKRKILNRI